MKLTNLLLSLSLFCLLGCGTAPENKNIKPSKGNSQQVDSVHLPALILEKIKQVIHSDSDSALNLSLTGIELAEKYEQIPVLSSLYVAQGDYYTNNGPIDSAIVKYNKAIALETEQEKVLDIQVKKMNALVEFTRFKDAIALGEPMVKNAANKKHLLSWVDMALLLAKSKAYLNHYSEAIKYANSCLQIAKSENAAYQMVETYKVYYGISLMQGHEKEALLMLKKRHEYFPLMTAKQKGEYFIHLGLVQNNINELEESKRSFLNALSYCRDLPKKYRYRTFQTLGNQYLGEKKYDSSVFYLKKAIAGFSELQDAFFTNYTRTFLMSAYWRMGQFEKVLEETEKNQASIQQNKDHSYNVERAYTSYWEAMAYFSLEELKEAERSLEKTLVLSRKNITLNHQGRVQELAINLYETMDDMEKSVQAQKALMVIRDSIRTIETREAMSEWQANLTLEEKKREQEVLKISNQALEAKRTLMFVIGGCLLLVSYLAVRFFYFVAKARKAEINSSEQQQALKRELRAANIKSIENEVRLVESELREKYHQMLQKDQLIESLKIQLEKTENSKENEPDKNDLLKKLDQVQAEDWEGFKDHFTTIHPKFYPWLKKHYPALTQKEIRICTLLKLNLSTKEIAVILNILPESVRKAMTRLRSKMDLESDKALRKILITGHSLN